MEMQETKKTLLPPDADKVIGNSVEKRSVVTPPSHNEGCLDLLSHDSTHLRLVIEAERQTSLARSRVASSLQNLSKEVKEHDKEAATILKQMSMDVAENTNCVGNESKPQNEPPEKRDDNSVKDVEEQNFDGLRILPDINLEIDNSSNPSVNKDGNDNKVFERMEMPSENDIEHLKQCILPLSPSGAHSSKGKHRISGQFEFKKMNNVLMVVRSIDEDSKQSYTSSVDSTKSKTSKSSRSRSWFRRRGSGASKNGAHKSLHSFSFSNAFTDDAWLQETYDKVAKKSTKEKKSGDLPPRAKKKIYDLGSTGAAASDIDREDVVSVVSCLSDLSLESITHKARKNTSMIVVTDSTLREIRIPDILCLKKRVKPSKLTKLKRKLSFNRGKASF